MESSVPPATTDIPLDSDKASENFSVSFYFIWFTFISLSFNNKVMELLKVTLFVFKFLYKYFIIYLYKVLLKFYNFVEFYWCL